MPSRPSSVFKDPALPRPCSGIAPPRPADKRPLAGTFRVFCPWGGNNPFSPSIPGRGPFSPSAPLRSLHRTLHSGRLPTSWEHGPWLPALLQLCSRESHILPNLRVSAPKTVCKTEIGTLRISRSPVRDPETFSSCSNLRLTFTTPLSLPFISAQKGFPPLCAYAILSPPIHIHTPQSCQTVPLQLWRPFCHSAAPFPGCSKCSDLNTVVLRDEENPGPPTSPPSSPTYLLFKKLGRYFCLLCFCFLGGLLGFCFKVDEKDLEESMRVRKGMICKAP